MLVPNELFPHETKLLTQLRVLPSERQAPMAKACTELLRIADHHTTCAGIGVDGFPCGSPKDTCDTCHSLVRTLEELSL